MPYFRAFQLFWLRLPYLWIQSLLWWISIVSYFDIQVNPCWNRTLTYHFPTSISLNHDWTLGVHPGTENSLHSTSIKVIQSLDFTAFSVNFRKDKKTCFHLCKAPFGARPVLGAPGGYNHSVPSSSLSWPPLRFSFVTMITWFSY